MTKPDDTKYGPPGNRKPGVVEYEVRKMMEGVGNGTFPTDSNSTVQPYIPNYPLPGNKTAEDVVPSWIPDEARNAIIAAARQNATGNMSGMCEYTIPTGNFVCRDENGTATVNATGYAGNKYGRNNASAQNVTNIGPLPEGDWLMGPAYDKPKNPNIRNLYPVPGKNSVFSKNTARDSWSFQMHGDNPTNNASSGCIITGKKSRLTPEDYTTIRVKPE